MGVDSDTMWKTVVNELVILANEIEKLLMATNTMEVIINEEVKKCRTVTYANFVCDYRPEKSEHYRAILRVGGDRLEYPHDASSPYVYILELKLLLNITISDARRGARFMSCDLKYFFLDAPMSRSEYIRINSKYFTPDIRDCYQIEGLIAADGYVYIKFIKGMYGLKQAAIIAYKQIIPHMEPHGYYPVPFTTLL